MPISIASKVHDNCKQFELMVDYLNEGVMRGSIFHEGLDRQVSFKDTVAFVNFVEETCDDLSFLYSGMNARRFECEEQPTDKKNLQEESRRTSGRLGTYQIRLWNRTSATWQGSIWWKEGNERKDFRSFMEMFLYIMDTSDHGTNFHSELDLCLLGKLGPTPNYIFARSGRETFVVRVMFRENHTIQGSISWLEQQISMNFRSYLELIKLMDSALHTSQMERKMFMAAAL